MKLAIEHIATYSHGTPSRHAVRKLRLTPRNDARQRILDWHLDLPGSCSEQLDAFGNRTHLLCLESQAPEIRIRMHGLVETFDEASLLAEEPISPLVFLRETRLTRASEALRHFAARHADAVARDRESGLMHVIEALAERAPAAGGDAPAGDAAGAFERRSGHNSDQVHVFLSLCRQLKVPVRYVSGYVCSDPAQLAGHAWAEAWVHDAGWVGFDVSGRRRVDGYYLSLAVGMDELDACPIRGAVPEAGLTTVAARAEVQPAQ